MSSQYFCTSFLSQVIPDKLKADIWFSQQPIGHNKLQNTVTRLCKAVGIEKFKTNLSFQATTATRLYHNNVDEQLIMECTGHRSIDGIRCYKQTCICKTTTFLSYSTAVAVQPALYLNHYRLQLLLAVLKAMSPALYIPAPLALPPTSYFYYYRNKPAVHTVAVIQHATTTFSSIYFQLMLKYNCQHQHKIGYKQTTTALLYSIANHIVLLFYIKNF